MTDVKRDETRHIWKLCDAEETWFGRELHGNKTRNSKKKKPTKELNGKMNDLEPKSTIILMKIIVEFNVPNDYNNDA